MRNGDKISVQTEIDIGSFGVFHKAIWRNRLVAVKTFNADTELNAYEAEFLQMSLVCHPNIIELFATSMDNQSKYLIMEYAENGTLHNLLHGAEQKQYSFKEAFEWAIQCAEGVAYLHSLQEPIILRYMNPKSLLITDQYRKLKISFGFNIAVLSSRANTDCHFSSYLAPEVFQGVSCNDKCDVYSWAMIVWELVTRKTPYSDFNDSTDLQSQKSIGLQPPIDESFFTDLKHLLTRGTERQSISSVEHESLPQDLKRLLRKCWSPSNKDRPAMRRVANDSVQQIFQKIIDCSMNTKKLSFLVNEIEIIGGFSITKWRDRKVFRLPCTFTKMYSQLSRIRHPNIIELLETEVSHVIFEYDENGSVNNLLYGKRFIYSPNEALHWAFQCAQAVAYMHAMKPEPIFHANLDTRFVLLTKDRKQIKICDFIPDIPDEKENRNCENGLYSYSKCRSAYIAPEVISAQRFSQASDVFSWATFSWEVIKREKPSSDTKLQPNNNWPENIKQLIRFCRSKNPKQRLSMTTVEINMKEIIQNGHDFENFKSNQENFKNLNDLHINELIEGGHRVYKGRWLNRQVAVLTYDEEEEKNSSIRKLLRVSHPNLIHIYGVSLSPNYQMCLITEYAENGTLHEFLHGDEQWKYSWTQALNWAQQSASGVAYLHNLKSCSALRPDLRSSKLLLTNQFRQLKLYKLNHCYPPIECSYEGRKILFKKYQPKMTDISWWTILMIEILTRQNPLSETFSECSLDLDKVMEIYNQVWPQSIFNLIKSSFQDSSEMDDVVSKLRTIKVNDTFILQSSYLSKRPTIPEVEFEFKNTTKILGHGAYGLVYRAKWEKRTVAAKEIDTRTKNMREAFKTELKQLTNVCHRNIIKVFATSTNKRYKYLIIEYAKNGSLDKYLHDSELLYSQDRGLNWTLQCAEGVRYLHNLKPSPVIHRDLKPQNLLLTKNGRRLKICDFGTVAELKTKMTSNRGTPHYMAPEVYKGKGKYTEKCDIYSLGITLWEILKRKRPYEEYRAEVVQHKTANEGLRPSIPDDWNASIAELVTSCWSGTPKERPSISYVRSSLKQIIVECMKMPTHFCRRENCSSISEIPIADLKFVLRGEIRIGKWHNRSVVLQKASLGTENLKVCMKHSHANIMKLLGYTCDIDSRYFVVEYTKILSLQEFLYGDIKRKYSASVALSWALQCAEGIAYFHNMNSELFLPFPLNPHYLLLTDKNRQHLKISVYGEGVSKHPSSYDCEPYIPREGHIHKASDVYSWAIFLAEVVVHQKPGKGAHNLRDAYKVVSEDSIFKLLNLCLDSEPNKRRSINEVVTVMKAVVNMPKHTNKQIIIPSAQVEVLHLGNLSAIM